MTVRETLIQRGIKNLLLGVCERHRPREFRFTLIQVRKVEVSRFLLVDIHLRIQIRSALRQQTLGVYDFLLLAILGILKLNTGLLFNIKTLERLILLGDPSRVDAVCILKRLRVHEALVFPPLALK